MLPCKNKNLQGVTLGLLALCLASDFVTAGSLRSIILEKQATLTKTKAIDCLTCDSLKNCALRRNELETCEVGSCLTIYNNKGLVKQRGCSSLLEDTKLTSYCNENTEKCLTCDNAECNLDEKLKLAVPEKPNTSARAAHRCYRCNGSEECEEDFNDVECTDLLDGVQCYMKFDENADVTNLGCMSDFASENEIIELVKRKQLFICDGNLCNGFENLPKPNECSSCSSSEGESCALQPNTIIATVYCNQVPYTQCFEQVDNDTNGITKRGCSASLDGDNLWKCLAGKKGGNCRLCDGDGCNNQLVPENRPKCQRCDSTSSPDCEATPASLSACPIYNKDENCISLFEAGVTKRGCSSDLQCAAGDRNCQSCKGDGCNTINIRQRAEEIYGIFQDLPLNCNTCEGKECETNKRNPRKCEGDPFQDCLTVFDAKGKIMQRGCEIELLEKHGKHCEENPALCFNCKSNGCNTIADATKYQECLFCDAATNPDCLFQPEKITRKRKCAEGCVSSLYQRKSDAEIHDFARMCFEDIESDDRPDCKAENNCVKCEGKNCNTDILPKEGRLSCLHCDGADCNKPVAKACTAYSVEDQCFMFFDAVDYSVLRSGCKSDLPKNEVDNHIKQYFLCDGDDCNNFDNLPKANTCWQCDSATDENCAVDPTKITAQTRCQTYPYTECVSYINEFNHTVRGCHYDSPNEVFKKCSIGDPDINCRLCTESDCNNGIYPSRRQRCHRCNSNDDANCEASPAAAQACPLYDVDDACVTKLVNNSVTQRGCRSELSCDGANRKNCQICNGTNCNVVNLIDQSIGDPGKFQGLPLNCYHCDNALECGGSSAGIARKCEGNNLQTCTVAFAHANGTVVGRGCSDLLETVCDEDGIDCHDCKSNGCNTAKQETDFIDCLYCDASEGDKCTFEVDTIKRTRKCHKSCMTALYPRTDDKEPVYELIRTCLDDKDPDEREECEAGKDGKCIPCNEAECNTADLGQRKSCYRCTGDECQAPSKATCRAVMDHDQCFIEYDETNSPVKMGCKSDYDPQDVRTLLLNKRIWLCDADDCNDIENVPAAQRCIVCNSRTNVNCAIKPVELVTDTNCYRQPFTQCYMRNLPDGNTERGCASNLEGDEFIDCLLNVNASVCMTCSGQNCNKEIFPANRLSCHICDADSDPNCEASPASAQICHKYNADEKCVTKVDGNGLTQRGCSSKVTCDASDSSNCQICESSDCNTSNLRRKSDGKPGIWQKTPLACYVCEGVKECTNPSSSTVCIEDHEYCMTVFNADGLVERRECSDVVEREFGKYCDANSDKCHNCNSYSCNNAKSLNDYADCIYCDSESNADCVANPAAVKNRRKCNGGCMTALYPKANSSVYTLTRTCLDDKNEADREICVNGDELCVACDNEAGCNTDLVPKNPWSCFACEGDACEDVEEPTHCKYYKPNDQCYVLFDDQSNIVSLGCASDLEDEFLADNIDKLFLCNDKENCNTWDNLPKPQRCIECDSTDDPDCASEPENIPAVSMCSALPITQCATLTSSADGTTKRGCLNQLAKPQMLSCLSGNSADCEICVGDACNKEIFPADRRRCQRCNSKDDPLCESAPTSSAVCPFYSPDEFCATKIVNEHTYRGCSSDFQCDATNPNYCRMCKDGDNCNTIDLISLNIGIPGTWQDLPLNCYHCVGDDCTTGNGLIRKCERDNTQTCGIVFDNSGKVVQRACSLQINDENSTYLQHCIDYPELCKFCKSNGCNLAKSLDDYVDCVFCDGSNKAECVTAPTDVSRRRTCHKSCMTSLYPRIKDESNPAYELTRSCLDDMDLDEREACAAGDMKYCKVCNGAACNTAALPETPRLKCHKCIGTDCSNPKSEVCTAYREHDQCFAIFDNNAVIRLGCSSELDNSDLLVLRRRLFQCDGNNCNQATNFPKPTDCVVCDSIKEPMCATMPAGPIIAAGCDDLPWTNCYTQVDNNGTTRRGCLSDVGDDTFVQCIKDENGNCVICDENNCNTEIFPANRRSCHRCDSRTDPTCESISPQNFISICPVYNANDSCVTKIEGARTLRGCATDFLCDPNDKKKCRICESDNCNTINLLGAYIGEPGKWQDLPLNCYHCEGDECANGNGVVRKCENNNLQTCMTVFNENGKVEKRACSDAVDETHLDYCEENSDKCFACKSNGCNTAKSIADFKDCFFCDSNDEKGCSVNFNATMGHSRKCQEGCVVALYPRSNVDDPAYELSRSCLNDLDLDDREKCKDGQLDFCKACEGERCNTMSVPEERHECLQCTDEDCEDFEASSCNAYHPNDQCYLLYDENNSISQMGCRSDFEMSVVTALIKQKRLIVCDGKNCNNPDMVQVKTCLACDSAEDPRCATNPNLVYNFVKCTTFPYTECGTTINEDGHTVRGCVASFSNDKFYGCITKNDSLCETCASNSCNSLDVYPANRIRCHQCDSKSNEMCTSMPNSNRVCPIYDPNDGCVSEFRDGNTYRGCASSMKCYNENDKRNCRTCKQTGCNTIDLAKVSADGEPGKWQAVPLTCRVCSDENNCKGSAEFDFCAENLYQNCMTVFNGEGNVIQRGCSDAVEAANAAWCESNPNSCKRCNSNGCNEATSLADYVECLACDTDVNGNCVTNLASVNRTRMCYKQCMTALYPREDEVNPAYHLTRSCLDDMDIDDREACAAGKKENCKACADEKCNTVAIPGKRLSCKQCKGDNCQLPEEGLCPTYREGDQCYILFDEQRSISAMGCRSEFSNADADFYFKKKRLFLCTDDNCNDVDALPKAQTCKICSSRTDISCATNPSVLDAEVTCNHTPFTECYTLWRKNGSTERGCASSLNDDEFLECLSDNSTVCQTCKGDSCNKEVFPEGRAACHICDSSFDPACEARPDNLGICPKYDPEDTCVTSYRNGVTLRGCSSSISCAAGGRSCSKCRGNGCNTINLAKRQDDNYGKWQDLPLRCHVCEGDDCIDSATTTVETCENNNEQDCVVVFDESGKVIARGCADQIEEAHEEWCDEHEDHCINCKSNECNAAVSLDEYVDCVYCDATKDLSCLWQPLNTSHDTRKCRGGCMTALYPADSSEQPAYELIRTCLDDKEASEQTTCSSDKDADCKACTGSSCNTADLPEDRLNCYYCTGGECEEPESMKCPLYKKGDQCYIWFDSTNNVNEMGCLSSFRNQELEGIIKTKRVFICNDGDNCNSLNKIISSQKCAVCDSRSDVMCAINAKSVSSFNECNMLPNTGCFSKLNNDGSTSRGCQTDLDDDVFVDCVLGKDNLCEPCSGDGCNREIFPADRQQCHTCTSLDDPDCESFPTLMQPCPIVSNTESCKTALSGNETVRGCSSDILCDTNDRLTCRACFGTECNAIDLRNLADDTYHGAFQALPLQCHECHGEHCLASLGPVVTCEKYDKQDCNTVFNANGTVRRRGCSDDVDDYEDLHCRKHPELCFSCKSNECNIAWELNEYVDCAFCNSTRSADCIARPQSSAFAHRKCYKECMVTMINNDEIIRSCLDDKEIFDQVGCRISPANGKECASCEDGNCNTFVYPRDRLQCHVCTSAECLTSAGEYCLNYDENDFCYAKYENGRVERMGCGSSVSKTQIDEWTAQKKLYRCTGEDCNDLTKLPSGGSCVACDSGKDATCAQNPTAVTSVENCDAPSNQCYAKIDNAGYTIRGCLNKLDQAEQQSCESLGTCAVCTGDKCNTDIFPVNRRKCHICESNNDASCAKSPNALQVCPRYVNDELCVSSFVEGITKRGCASDVSCEENDTKRCRYCNTDGCNIAEVGSGALVLSGSLLLSTLLAYISIRLFSRL